MYRGKAELVEIVKETHDTKTYRFRLLNGKMEFKPGQFSVLAIPAELGGGPQYSRAYSIASSPTEEFVDLTMNVVGVFTKKMDSFETGVQLNLTGPFGKFYLDETKHSDVVTISGGTGVTPFRSMWRYVKAKQLPIEVTPIVSYKTLADYIYRDELEEIKKKGVTTFVTLTREESNEWTGHRNRITGDTIREICGDLSGKTFFICGSNAMNDEMTQTLLSLGVAKEQIITEKWGEY